MVYATAGLAVGGVKNSYANYCTTCDVWNDRSTRVGFAVGGGVEHMLNRNWSLRLEGLFVDLGKKSIRANDKTTTFSNQAVIARVGLNYKF
jgi:outer membrane immunogenic protein